MRTRCAGRGRPARPAPAPAPLLVLLLVLALAAAAAAERAAAGGPPGGDASALPAACAQVRAQDMRRPSAACQRIDAESDARSIAGHVPGPIGAPQQPNLLCPCAYTLRRMRPDPAAAAVSGSHVRMSS